MAPVSRAGEPVTGVVAGPGQRGRPLVTGQGFEGLPGSWPSPMCATYPSPCQLSVSHLKVNTCLMMLCERWPYRKRPCQCVLPGTPKAAGCRAAQPVAWLPAHPGQVGRCDLQGFGDVQEVLLADAGAR